jgi:hypothetical protein
MSQGDGELFARQGSLALNKGSINRLVNTSLQVLGLSNKGSVGAFVDLGALSSTADE